MAGSRQWGVAKDSPGCVGQVGFEVHTTTATGHKLLPDCIRVLQADSVDVNSLEVILGAMNEAGWAADKVALAECGQGSNHRLWEEVQNGTSDFGENGQ